MDNTKMGDQLASTICFCLAEIFRKLGIFVSSTGISKKKKKLNWYSKTNSFKDVFLRISFFLFIS